MSENIVTRLRALANALAIGEWIALTETCATAADEIERLRVELDGARLAYRGACYDRDRIKAERDDARALYCGMLEAYKRGDGREEAKKRGWFCFEEKP